MAHELTAQRLTNQHIASAGTRTPAEVVCALGALQAQDYAQALWAVGLRAPGSTAKTVEQALAEGSIVRTWPMRGTLHLIAPANARWMLGLMAPRVFSATASRQRSLGLDDKGRTFGQSFAALGRALQGGKRLTRAAAMAVLEQAGIATAAQRGYHILGRAAMEAVICLGPMQDKQQTFVLLDEWIAPSRPLSREESLAQLTRLYYSGHGPATQQDFMWWTGLTATDAKAGLELMKSELHKETFRDKTYWLAKLAAPPSRSAAGTQLLPGFDEYLLGYKDRSTILAAEHSNQVCPGGNGVFAPMLVVDGQIVGTWKRTIKKSKVHIALQPFTRLGAAELAATQAPIDRFAAFWGLEAARD